MDDTATQREADRQDLITRPGLHGDGATLFLSVTHAGSRSWIQRVTIGGKRRDIGLGPWPAVILAQARDIALRNRVAILDGRDPLAERRRVQAEAQRQAAVPTFQEAAAATHAANRRRWRSATVAATWIQQLKLHAYPILGTMPVDQIQPEHVLRVLTREVDRHGKTQPLWTAQPATARKLRAAIRKTLSWCQRSFKFPQVWSSKIPPPPL